MVRWSNSLHASAIAYNRASHVPIWLAPSSYGSATGSGSLRLCLMLRHE